MEDLLLETGDTLLLETGDALLLESASVASSAPASRTYVIDADSRIYMIED